MPEWRHIFPGPKYVQEFEFSINPYFQDPKSFKEFEGLPEVKMIIDSMNYDFIGEKEFLEKFETPKPEEDKNLAFKETNESKSKGIKRPVFLDKSFIKLFEEPVASPFDLLELKTLDEINELSSILATRNITFSHKAYSSNLDQNFHHKTITLEPEDRSVPSLNRSQSIPENSLDTHDKVSNSINLDNGKKEPTVVWEGFNEDQTQYANLLSTMGFSEILIDIAINQKWPNKDAVLDELISLQDLLDSQIKTDSILFFLKKLGDDRQTVKCWIGCLIQLKNLGYKEIEAREAIADCNGKFDMILKRLKK